MEKEVYEVLDKIEKNGFKAYLVGGYVRDYVRKVKTSDIDIATNAKVLDLIKIFDNYNIKPTLYGNVFLTIPAGTQSGEKLRLRSKGISNVNTKKKGDMFVITKVIIPEKLTRTQKDLIEQLSKTELDNSKYFKTYKNCIK